MDGKFAITSTIFDKRGKVLAIGQNSYTKSHPTQKHFAAKADLKEKIFLHSEIAALIKVRRGVPHKILVERYSKSGRPQNAAPCPICMLAIKEAGIKLVEHTI